MTAQRADRLVSAAIAISAALALSPAAGRGAPAPAFGFPVPEQRTLENGLRVAVFSDSRFPVVQVLLMIPAGASADPGDLPGVANLTAALLRRGTSSRDADSFADELDRLGAEVTAAATRDHTTVSGRFLASEFEAGLELMSDAVVNPLFPDDELQDLKLGTLRGIVQLFQDPSSLAEMRLWGLVFEGHPYGRPPFGTARSLADLSRDAIRAFYRDHYRPDRAILAIAGDVTPEDAFDAAEEWFGRWTGKAVSVEMPRPVSQRGRRIQIVDVPGSPVTALAIGGLAPRRGDPDELPFSSASVLLGGVHASRLSRAAGLSSLARDAQSYVVPLESAGIFGLRASVRSDSVGAAVERLEAQVRRFLSEPPSEAEWAPVRHATLNAFSMRFETLSSILSHWCAAEFYRLPGGDFEGHRERLGSLRATDVAAAAGRWLDPDRLSIVAVGPAAEVQPQLEAFGPIELIGPEGPVVPVEGPALPSTTPTREEVERGRRLIKQAVAAHGGISRLRRIKDVTVEADATLSVGGRELRGQIVQVRKDPYQMLFTTTFGGLVTEQTLSGDVAWSVSQASPNPEFMDSIGVAGLRAGFESNPLHLLRAAASDDARLAARGPVRIGERGAEAVEVISNGQRRMVYLDARTHRLIAVDLHELGQTFGGFDSRRQYGDFRDVGGVLWPHTEERFRSGERVMQLTVTKVAFDTGVEDFLFERPEPEPELPPPAR